MPNHKHDFRAVIRLDRCGRWLAVSETTYAEAQEHVFRWLHDPSLGMPSCVLIQERGSSTHFDVWWETISCWIDGIHYAHGVLNPHAGETCD